MNAIERFLFRYLYNVLTYLISIYAYLRRVLYYTKYVYFVKTVIIDELAFSEYVVNHNDRCHTLYILDESEKCKDALVKEAFQQNVTHACICSFDTQGEITEYILDITEHLKHFRYHFTRKHDKIYWKHILSFITKTHPNTKVEGGHFVYIHTPRGDPKQYRIDDLFDKHFTICNAEIRSKMK